LPEIKRHTSLITKTTLALLDEIATPFFLFVNFTDVEYVAHKTREGSFEYSLAIRQFDKALGAIIKSLEDKELFDKTNFFITTNYGFEIKSRKHTDCKKTWIISNHKIRYKGNQTDIVPTILHTYGLKGDLFKPKLLGRVLIN
jgi:membrane-anchored protein YejM (alkaline phosphatase superfamily)